MLWVIGLSTLMMALGLAAVVMSPLLSHQSIRGQSKVATKTLLKLKKKAFLDAMVAFIETISKAITQPEASQGSGGGPCANGHSCQVLDKENVFSSAASVGQLSGFLNK